MDTLKKQTVTASQDTGASGKVRFDDRGNAVWETQRGRRLEHAGLSLLEEDGVAVTGKAQPNIKGGRLGYDPYQTDGLIIKRESDRPRKKDLRALSQWIQMQKALSAGGG